jgi:hypothetical protein
VEHDERARHGSWQAIGIRADIPQPARVYNYLLGGKDNFAADREAAEMSLALVPEMRDSARGNRLFLGRAVAFLRDQGIRQFLDLGSGLPASPNTHEIAAAGGAECRVVYVDIDPVVYQRADALLADCEVTHSVLADLRDVDEVLSAAGRVVDLTRPVGLLMIACLHNIPDADDPAGIVARYLDALAPGSHVAISHVTGDFAPGRMAQVTASYAERGTVFVGRTRAQVTAMFNGRDLVEPGVAQISYWRPDGGAPALNAGRVWGYAGVARV